VAAGSHRNRTMPSWTGQRIHCGLATRFRPGRAGHCHQRGNPGRPGICRRSTACRGCSSNPSTADQLLTTLHRRVLATQPAGGGWLNFRGNELLRVRVSKGPILGPWSFIPMTKQPMVFHVDDDSACVRRCRSAADGGAARHGVWDRRGSSSRSARRTTPVCLLLDVRFAGP